MEGGRICGERAEALLSVMEDLAYRWRQWYPSGEALLPRDEWDCGLPTEYVADAGRFRYVLRSSSFDVLLVDKERDSGDSGDRAGVPIASVSLALDRIPVQDALHLMVSVREWAEGIEDI